MLCITSLNLILHQWCQKACNICIRTWIALDFCHKRTSKCHQKTIPLCYWLGQYWYCQACSIFLVGTMSITLSTAPSDATCSWTLSPCLLKLSLVLCNAILLTRLIALIETIISTKIKTCSDTRIYNPFVGCCKFVGEIIRVMENSLDIGNGKFRRRRRP